MPEDNRIDGGAGADLMAGGADNDTYVVDDAGDVVTETCGAGGNDTVRTALDRLDAGCRIRKYRLTGRRRIAAPAMLLDNDITGNAGETALRRRGIDTRDGLDGQHRFRLFRQRRPCA